jgi:hypothetical protein
MYQGSKANRNQIKAYKEQVANVMRNYNYGVASMNKAETQSYHQSVGELFELSLNGMQNNASVEAGMSEAGYEGRTANQAKRGLNGALQRQSRAIKDNNELQVSSIREAKDNLRIEVNQNLKMMKKQTNSQLTKGVAAAMQVINGAAIGAATAWAGGALGGLAAGAAGGTAGATAGATGASTAGATASTAASSATSALGVCTAANPTGAVLASGASSAASTATSTASAFSWGSFFSNMGSNALKSYDTMQKYMQLIQGMQQMTAGFSKRGNSYY